MEIVAIIPARGGSKGIPRKNLVDFCGFPLLSWSIAAAKRCAGISMVYVSTDCPEIACTARDFGAVVVDRPAELATDYCSSETALIHACQEIGRQSGRQPDAVVMMQATSPLREAHELGGAMQHFIKNGCDSLFSAAYPEDFLVWLQEGERMRSLNYDWHDRKRRQDAGDSSKLCIETGSFYITKTELLIKSGNRLGGRIGVWAVPMWESHEIDSLEGLEFCRLLMSHHKLDRLTPAEFKAKKNQDIHHQ
jgi:CMP-N,N'-diacetyllegionaminic acid synthase